MTPIMEDPLTLHFTVTATQCHKDKYNRGVHDVEFTVDPKALHFWVEVPSAHGPAFHKGEKFVVRLKLRNLQHIAGNGPTRNSG
jgi:hypothetical protein